MQAAQAARDVTAYLALREEFQVSDNPTHLKVGYDAYFAGPGLGTPAEERLGLIEAWVTGHAQYGKLDGGLARLALEGADTARALRRWSDATRLLAVAEADFGERSDHVYFVEPRIWFHDVAGVLYREMGLFDVAQQHLDRQAQWIRAYRAIADHAPKQACVFEINAMFNQATLAMSQHRLDTLLRLEEEAQKLFEEYAAASGGLTPQEGLDEDVRASTAAFVTRQQDRLAMLVGMCALEDARRRGRPYDLAKELLQSVVSESNSTYRRRKCQLYLAHIELLLGDGDAARRALVTFDALMAEEGASSGPAIENEHHAAAMRGWLAAEHGTTEAEWVPALAAVDHQYDAFLDGLRSAPIESQGIGYTTYYESRLLLDAHLRLHARLHPDEPWEEHALEQILTLQSLGTLARELKLGRPDRARVEDVLLRPGHGLLVVHPGYERSWVLALDEQGLVGEVIAADHRLIPHLRELALAVLDAVGRQVERTPDLDRAATAVTQALLSPAILERVLGWESVAVVGTDSLGWLPFELLRGEAGEPFGSTHAVTYLPSLPLGTHLAEQDTSPVTGAAPQMALVAGTGVDPDRLTAWKVADLAPFEERIVCLAGAYGESASVRSGAGAAPSAAREVLAGARVGQVLAHGLYAADRIRPAGILLAGDAGAVWTDELEGWTWPELTVLSACGVHRGPLRRGDDGRSLLAGAVLRGGARSVLVPYVDVELGEHLELAEAFHDALLYGGLSPERALLEARRSVGHGLHRYLVHLVGVGDRPLVSAPLERPRSWWPWWIAAGLALVLGGVALHRRRLQEA